MIEWFEVHDSERVTAVGYDSDAETIYARFPDGTEWWYGGCPPMFWQQFMAPGQSKGQYINEVLNQHPNGRHTT